MNYKKFSLVMATYGREEEVGKFLHSIKDINYTKENIEIIIVDQNDKIKLKPIIKEYENDMNIIYIKSEEKGLALNRNKGIKRATGDIIAFPDDDCEYLKDTLQIVNNYFNKTNCDIVMGRIVERDGNDSLRVWPKEFLNVNKANFYKKCSSVTVFLNRSNCIVEFNNDLGAGKYFGACEDADLIYKNIKNNKKVLYNPEIKIYHPHYDSNSNMSNDKIYKYGLGFGAMVKANFDMSMTSLFIKAQGYHLLKSMMYGAMFKFDKSQRSWLAFTSRIKGIIEYK